MGIDTRAVIFIGLPYSEIEHDELDEMVDGGEVDCCPPYYDAPRDKCIVGAEIAISYGRPKELTWDQAGIEAAKAEFKKTFGLEPKVWLSPSVL